ADGRDFLIDTDDGIVLDNYSMPEYATYQTFPATVVLGCGPITGSITSPACPVTSTTNGSFIDFVVTAASDNGGDPIVLYEVDTDYDGSAFTADASNTDGNFVAVGPFNNPNCGTPPEDPVTYTVAFRATDSCTPANETVFATCDVTVDICCSDESLLYEFTSSIEGWAGGGCGLTNNDLYGWGHFAWCTNAAGSCFSGGALTTGGDNYGSGCSYLTDHYSNADFNVVSPSINLPTAADTTIEFNHCNAFGSGGQAYLYISLAGCTGPWTEIWTTTTASECISDESIDISSYSGTDVMFRFQYTCPNVKFDGGSCGNAGIVIDEVEISGCFTGGSLHEN
ncbi:hypothetical protein J7L05_01245, partial [bacterium]|nr:hypothetical protein [bacterium]